MKKQHMKHALSIVNHELKSQLFGIKVYAQLLEKRITKNEITQLLPYVQKINTSVDALSFAVSDFIDYIRISENVYSLTQDFVQIDEVLQQITKLIRALFPNAKITTKGKTTQPVFIDRNKIEKVIYVLMTNAAMYSLSPANIDILISQSKKNITVEVADKGFGIDAENLKKLGEAFFSVPLKNYKERIGLGLFLAKKIIDMHHGKLQIKSVLGKGSRFIFSLPINPSF